MCAGSGWGTDRKIGLRKKIGRKTKLHIQIELKLLCANAVL